MAARSTEEAVDAFLSPIRAALTCLAPCTVFGSGQSLGRAYEVTFFAAGRGDPNVLRLSTHGGVGEVLFRPFQRYIVAPLPVVAGRRRCEARTIGYHFRILDIAERELAVYDWHPDGLSPVTIPHLHVPAAEAVVMAQQPSSPQSGLKTHLGKAHFPTGLIRLEDVAELLIRDFAVVPARADWQDVLQRNREAIGPDRG